MGRHWGDEQRRHEDRPSLLPGCPFVAAPAVALFVLIVLLLIGA